ncbi:Nuclear envelope morphology protein 1 [Kalmusia sp. IMI 367209]|nr:Nuclear envelope morphology protein 1 [Kalmusia sp. IMI 367209]
MVARRADVTSYIQTDATASDYDEKTPLLQGSEEPFPEVQKSKRWLFPQRISDVVLGGVKLLIAPVVLTGQYLFACFHYEDGRFSLIAPLYHITHPFTRTRRKKRTTAAMQASDSSDTQEKGKRKGRSIATAQKTRRPPRRSPSIASTSTAITSDSELDSERPPTRDGDYDAPSRHTRSKSSTSSTAEEIAPAKRQIRIKLHNDEALRQRKAAKKMQSSKGGSDHVSTEAANALKSPTGPITSKQLTKFPRAPQPPRPLVPRRQPSYSAASTASLGPHQKTLILDLDETLIHSMAKGGRYTTGHMVEVKLQQPVGAGGQIIGPQVPILYYVHKRPHCDEFLKKVCKWYNLVIFTASVQEYADPVIDWLETERKYFAGRYYRQHCTFRNGAYIKDLAQVEPDLSRVMIIDNSPMCYVFHEDNAIPIEGWINDPTDHGLLHLIPLLEGLQYVTDVRALLALRLGQPQSV